MLKINSMNLLRCVELNPFGFSRVLVEIEALCHHKYDYQ